MGIPDIYQAFKYRCLDVGITIQHFEAEGDEVEIEEFVISLDYGFSDKPHPFDHIALMINLMLSDGRHLQEKIFDCISPEDMETINEKCMKEWRTYWQDVATNHDLAVDEQFCI